MSPSIYAIFKLYVFAQGCPPQSSCGGGVESVVNVTLNECAMTCIVSKPRGAQKTSRQKRQSRLKHKRQLCKRLKHQTVAQAASRSPTAQAASRALPHLPFMCFLVFLPCICFLTFVCFSPFLAFRFLTLAFLTFLTFLPFMSQFFLSHFLLFQSSRVKSLYGGRETASS